MITAAHILSAKILVVDDKEANICLIEGMLRIAGYTSVSSTTNPNEVCGLHDTNRYSLILLDLQMPGMDGFQVMEGLKKLKRMATCPSWSSPRSRITSARARSWSQGFRQQTVRSGRTSRSRPQHPGSPSTASGNQELQPGFGGDGAGVGSQPRDHPH